MPALIGVQKGLFRRLKPGQGLIQHLGDQLQNRAPCHLPGDDFTIGQVHHGREVPLLIVDFEFRHISHPFLIRLIGLKLALEQIRRNRPDRTRIRFIFLDAGTNDFKPSARIRRCTTLWLITTALSW